MKISRDALQEISEHGRKATRDEIDAMARELLQLREEEAKRDDGTSAVTIEHIGAPTVNGWFSPRASRIPRAQLHVGARFSLAGRVYGIVGIEGDRVRVR